MKYGLEQVGCYADGTFGHDHIRARLRELVEEMAIEDLGMTRDFMHAKAPVLLMKPYVKNDTDVLVWFLHRELGDPHGRDYEDEDAAIALLNDHAVENGYLFGMNNGDLMFQHETWWYADE